MEHRLAMDAEAMRRVGYATVDALVARLADPEAAALTAKGRAALAGLERADSVTLDPHKWLYQPMECGCVLIRDGPERRGTALAEELERGGTALVSTTRLAGRHAIRLCILNPTTTAGHVRQVIEHFAGALAPAGGAPVPVAAHPTMPGPDVLGAVPLLAGVPASIRHAVQARGVCLDVTAGEEVIRRWDADRFFYIVLAGRYDVFIDTRLIRTHGPGDHFGELAARDWGGGYGYARLATIRCAEPGRLLKLTTEDLAWLVDSQPTVKARIAATLAERLQHR
jgi:aromatic-L-amino-acid/L-tryptophan decarboxylase